jgi:hypothetical protein
MKVYVAMHAVPWERFSITTEHPINAEHTMTVAASSSFERAGFLPIFWSKAAAEKQYPDVEISEAEVADDWNPWLNEQKNG